MKEKEKSPEREPNVKEAIELPDTEFKRKVVRKLKELRLGIDRLSENLNKGTVSMKKGHGDHKKSEMKNVISEMENILEEINSRLHEAEDSISNFGDNIAEKIKVELKKRN